MWEFIKYCLKCALGAIAGASGSNPSGLTVKTAAIGMATLFVLAALGCLTAYIIYLIVNCIRR